MPALARPYHPISASPPHRLAPPLLPLAYPCLTLASPSHDPTPTTDMITRPQPTALYSAPHHLFLQALSIPTVPVATLRVARTATTRNVLSGRGVALSTPSAQTSQLSTLRSCQPTVLAMSTTTVSGGWRDAVPVVVVPLLLDVCSLIAMQRCGIDKNSARSNHSTVHNTAYVSCDAVVWARSNMPRRCCLGTLRCAKMLWYGRSDLLTWHV